MYRVLHYFKDRQDDFHAYNAGDEFPRKGLNVTEKRLDELLGPNNRQHKPLIELVQEKEPETSEIEKPKRGRKKSAD